MKVVCVASSLSSHLESLHEVQRPGLAMVYDQLLPVWQLRLEICSGPIEDERGRSGVRGDVLEEGHDLLTLGLHAPTYLQLLGSWNNSEVSKCKQITNICQSYQLE